MEPAAAPALVGRRNERRRKEGRGHWRFSWTTRRRTRTRRPRSLPPSFHPPLRLRLCVRQWQQSVRPRVPTRMARVLCLRVECECEGKGTDGCVWWCNGAKICLQHRTSNRLKREERGAHATHLPTSKSNFLRRSSERASGGTR